MSAKRSFFQISANGCLEPTLPFFHDVAKVWFRETGKMVFEITAHGGHCPSSLMPHCGPPDRPFAATAKSRGVRIHSSPDRVCLNLKHYSSEYLPFVTLAQMESWEMLDLLYLGDLFEYQKRTKGRLCRWLNYAVPSVGK